METLVLVKAVPDVEGLRVDPATGRAVREGVPLLANPFDQRALRVALDLRRPGETVTVMSMGPPAAEAMLHEACGLGADRAILLTDPALAGSDTLVTARVLRRAADRLRSDLILTGRWSTDSETGQVPPQLAELLGRAFVPSARRLARAEGGSLEADIDTEVGWATTRVSLPVVVSVGEKIAKLRKLLPEEVRASMTLAVERWSLVELGLPTGEVGLVASPTFVARLVEEQGQRTPRVFAEGSPAARVRGATDLVRSLLGRGSAQVPAPATVREVSGRFLVLLTGADGAPVAAARDVIAGIRREHPQWAVEAVSIGPDLVEDERRLVAGAGAARLWTVPTHDGPVAPESAVEGLRSVSEIGPAPVGVAILADLFGRVVAGRLSAREGWGLTGDATGIAVESGGRPLYRKPAFGGRWVAEIGTRSGPAVVTVRPGAFPHGSLVRGDPVPQSSLPFVPVARSITLTGWTVERDPGWGDPLAASVLLIAGQGVGGPEGVRELLRIAPAFGAELGATRRVVDLGWAPRQLQVGLTGLAVEPRLAILVGVGGSLNHLVGLRRAGVLLAVNRDPAAAVFQHVDVGLVADWREVLPILANELGPTAAPLRAT